MQYPRRAPPPAYTGQRRLYVLLAVLFLIIGAGMMAYAGHQILYEGKTPGQLIWVRPNGPAGVPGADGQPPPQSEPLGTETFRLVIEKIGIDAPVAAYGLDENAIPTVPYEADLVAWYNFSRYPGEGENAVFAGHVTWRGEGVFYRLNEVAPGDHVRIKREDGSQLVYEITDSLLVDPTAAEAQRWLLPAGEDVITLVTCGGERTLTDDFIGAEYSHRQVVRARLIAVA
ncbi:MAG TPA: class F sortase [Dehalococcoidia bacterium]|nr:class F sortase [Dehalococcoidia bacterium]